MEDITHDYYDILQVSPSAEKEVIEAAYRKLAQKYHPDINKSPEAEEKMRRINVAHEVLSDPAKRAAYDASRRIAQTSRSQKFKTILPRFMGLVTLIMIIILVALRLSPRIALLLIVIFLVWFLYSLFFRNQRDARGGKGK